MTTINEKEKEYLAKITEKAMCKHHLVCIDEVPLFTINGIRQAYIQGTKDFLSLPLLERLTQEEKEKIRKEWSNARKPGWYARPYSRGRFRMLQDIFGTDFFKEGGWK